DVAMDDAGAVQCGDTASEFDRDIATLLEPDQRPARQPRRQQFALVERHDSIEAGLPPRRQFEDPADPWTVDARADPSFAHECGVVGRRGGDLGLWKFERHLAAL